MSRVSDINLIHRYLAGECNQEEKIKIQRWMEADPQNRQVLNSLRKIWEVQPKKEFEPDIQIAWDKLATRIGSGIFDEEEKEFNSHELHDLVKNRSISYSNSNFSRWIKVAAIIMLGLFSAWLFIDFENVALSVATAGHEVSEQAMREVATERGHQSQVTFNDGSKVFLNAESRIRFRERFDSKEREVYLEGEAYFEVEHNSDVAFVVHANDAWVKVLGTRFNVKNRPEDQKVVVAVAQGKVSVHSNSEISSADDSGVTLVENQMSVVKSGSAPEEPQTVESNEIMGWLVGDFIFDEVPFDNVLREWERRFDIDFSVKDSTLLSVKFSGEFRREPLDEMLHLTSQSLKFNYEREGNIIIIEKKED